MSNLRQTTVIKTNILWPILLVLSVMLNTVPAYAQTDQLVNEAEVVMAQYFSALREGNVSTIRSLLGPSLLRKRERLLSNPAYSSKLVEYHKSVEYAITGQNIQKEKTISITVSITSSGSIAGHYRFTLQKNKNHELQIEKEEEIL